ncbi:hypothetical protein CSV72_09880 [Sporosarcina sp. P20a]|uniref:hypothetical protein n=1 Tax=Sporosarcina sp. P20a TaxID=2048256 RepID=UPI000C167095|nr:hypothetical protein [Sporosarcina sp. P20a]PIC86116.1 hypothetical protein CSV72_09880 [Sporosarcina sp. P20a]
MLINQKLSTLYEEWRKEYPGHFVGGGIVNEEWYESCETKVLYLLKEVNDEKQNGNWSLVYFIRKQIEELKFYRTMVILGLWSSSMQQGFPSYNSILERKEKNIAEGLSSLAITNLKKSGGKGSSNMADVKSYAIVSKELWIKEIELINPDIVLCCGTFSIVREILDFQTEVCESGALYGDAFGTRFVEFTHPMYRISPKINYAYFKETMKSC